MAGQAYITESWHTGPAGLLREVDAGCGGYTEGFQNGAACIVSNGACHFLKSLRKDLRAGPYGNSVILLHWFWTIGT